MVISDFSTAVICSIFGLDDRDDAGNYRLDSLLSSIYRVKERILKDKTMLHLCLICAVVKSQHSFMQQWSCMINHLIAEEQFAKHFENENIVGIAFLEFEKKQLTLQTTQIFA